jgi:hypothetical protein
MIQAMILCILSTFPAQFLSKKYFGCPLLNVEAINSWFEHLMSLAFRESLMGAISSFAGDWSESRLVGVELMLDWGEFEEQVLNWGEFELNWSLKKASPELVELTEDPSVIELQSIPPKLFKTRSKISKNFPNFSPTQTGLPSKPISSPTFPTAQLRLNRAISLFSNLMG